MFEYSVRTLPSCRSTELWFVHVIFQMVECRVFSTRERVIFLILRWWFILNLSDQMSAIIFPFLCQLQTGIVMLSNECYGISFQEVPLF